MKEGQDIPNDRTGFYYDSTGNTAFDDIQSLNKKEDKINTKVIPLSEEHESIRNTENFLGEEREQDLTKKNINLLTGNDNNAKKSSVSFKYCPNLFRLFVKKGEYVYARAKDIIIVESCDHLVKVYSTVLNKFNCT